MSWSRHELQTAVATQSIHTNRTPPAIKHCLARDDIVHSSSIRPDTYRCCRVNAGTLRLARHPVPGEGCNIFVSINIAANVGVHPGDLAVTKVVPPRNVNCVAEKNVRSPWVE